MNHLSTDRKNLDNEYYNIEDNTGDQSKIQQYLDFQLKEHNQSLQRNDNQKK